LQHNIGAGEPSPLFDLRPPRDRTIADAARLSLGRALPRIESEF
jgi:hypothetical protein